MTKLSQKFVIALKLSTVPAYKLAPKAGIHPSTLSCMIHGDKGVCSTDERLIRLGRFLKLTPAEIFEEVDQDEQVIEAD